MIFPIQSNGAVVMTKGLFNWSWAEHTSEAHEQTAFCSSLLEPEAFLVPNNWNTYCWYISDVSLYFMEAEKLLHFQLEIKFSWKSSILCTHFCFQPNCQMCYVFSTFYPGVTTSESPPSLLIKKLNPVTVSGSECADSKWVYGGKSLG